MRLETTRYEARKRVRGAVALTVLLSLFSLLIVYLYPSIAEAGADFFDISLWKKSMRVSRSRRSSRRSSRARTSAASGGRSR